MHFCRSLSTPADPGLTAKAVNRLWYEEEGQDLVEYGLLIVLVGLAAMASMRGLASSVSKLFSSAATNITSTS